MRCSLPFRSIVVSLLLVAPPALAGVSAGDLLVSDQNGARVLAVDPDTGSVRVLSPPPGGPNLLVAPAGIAMSEIGMVYVVDESTNQLVGIDPSNGAQFVVQAGGGGPLSVGSEPFGLALRDSESAIELWVSARGSAEIRAIVAIIGLGITSFPLVQDPRLANARGVAVGGDVLAVAMDDGQGYYLVAFDGGTIIDPLELPPPNVAAWDVEPYEYQVTYIGTSVYYAALTLRDAVLLPPYGIPACDPEDSRIVSYGTWYMEPMEPKPIISTIEPADGTPLHCPTALVTGLDSTLYATDSEYPNGAGSQLVRLWPGTEMEPVIVAALPDSQSGVMFPGGLAVAPVSVPEPGAGAAQLALLASLLVLAHLRSRAGRTG